MTEALIYKRLRDVPRQCSVCGAKEYGKPLPLHISLASRISRSIKRWPHRLFHWVTRYRFLKVVHIEAANLLRAAYSGWQIHREFFPLKKLGPLWRWRAHCADCMMRDAWSKPSFLDKVKPTQDWKGGTFTIPFTGGSK